MKPILQQLLLDDPIVVTGVGGVSAGGNSADALWESARSATVHATWRDFEFGDGTLRLPVCPAPDFDALLAPYHRAKKLDRGAQMALAAADQAWKQSGLAEGGVSPERIGVFVGTSRGPAERQAQSSEATMLSRLLPSFSATCTIGSFSGALAQYFAVYGPSSTVSTTCASGATAIALGAEQILLGLADVMLVGGADASLHPLIVAPLNAAGVVGSHEDPAKTCRPFDRTRNGMCMGEGAGMLVLESTRSARARGAKPLGRLIGWSKGVENAGRAGVGQGGAMLANTINRAMHAAGISPGAIDYLNTHGTGTVVNDVAEATAIHKVFGDAGATPPCSSTKPVTGHCLGATPALEAIICLQALLHQVIPPTANCEDPDPACAIDAVPLRARGAALKTVMSTSLGFWGSQATLIFSAA